MEHLKIAVADDNQKILDLLDRVIYLLHYMGDRCTSNRCDGVHDDRRRV